MAVGQNTGEPWMMCKQQTAPDPVVCLFLLTKLPQLHIERRRAGLNQVMVQQENFISYSWGYQVSHD